MCFFRRHLKGLNIFNINMYVLGKVDCLKLRMLLANRKAKLNIFNYDQSCKSLRLRSDHLFRTKLFFSFFSSFDKAYHVYV